VCLLFIREIFHCFEELSKFSFREEILQPPLEAQRHKQAEPPRSGKGAPDRLQEGVQHGISPPS
jgi:hypothetical protein